MFYPSLDKIVNLLIFMLKTDLLTELSENFLITFAIKNNKVESGDGSGRTNKTDNNFN